MQRCLRQPRPAQQAAAAGWGSACAGTAPLTRLVPAPPPAMQEPGQDPGAAPAPQCPPTRHSPQPCKLLSPSMASPWHGVATARRIVCRGFVPAGPSVLAPAAENWPSGSAQTDRQELSGSTRHSRAGRTRREPGRFLGRPDIGVFRGSTQGALGAAGMGDATHAQGLPHSMVLLAQRPAAHGECWWHWLTTMVV